MPPHNNAGRAGLALAGAILCLFQAAAVAAPSPSEQEMEDWFNAKSASGVNEGVLTFLTERPGKPVHHHQNHIRITPESLASGWTELSQCHDNLDAVPRAQITFRAGYVRRLAVAETRAIGKAWVEEDSVQLVDIAPGARLCLKAETRALTDSGGGYFSLTNGPYMRKFLDGYYPMRVSLDLDYPAGMLRLIDVSPGEQPGFRVRESEGHVSIDTLFEGELRTQVQFERR